MSAIENGNDGKYWAFISYSHSDERWAAWLHRRLETYRVPRELVGRSTDVGSVPVRLFPIFRDREELAGASELGVVIEEALRQSRCQIVICSPRSATSKWVNEEIRFYKQLGRHDRILALIIAGEPGASSRPHGATAECFPPTLRFRVDAAGRITDQPTEPMAADARPGKDGREHALLRLIAGLLGLGFDELRRRERQRAKQRQQQQLGAASLLSAVSAIAYLGLADAGSGVAGGDVIRRWIDDREWSVFRPAPTADEIARVAAKLRPLLFARLQTEQQSPTEWIDESPARKIGPKKSLAVWVASQGITAALRHPEAGIAELRPFLKDLEGAFSNGYPLEVDGIKYGWQMSRSDAPQVEPALWTLLALKTALARPGLLSDSEKDAYRRLLEYTQEVTEQFGPKSDGGWNIYARQVRPELHCIYSTALALLAVLELRDAGILWRSSAERRDEILIATARYLIEAFNSRSSPPGWHFSSDPIEGPVLDGLTLQIYATLLRAEAEVGLAISRPILESFQRHLSSLATRPIDFPESRGSFLRLLYDFPPPGETGPGPLKQENMSIGFAWHPWAIESAARWLKRQERLGAPLEERVHSRRILGRLVVDFEQLTRSRAESRETQTWGHSEMLLVLSGLTRQ